MINEHLPWLNRVRERIQGWRRAAKAKLSFVRRRVYRSLERRHDALAAVFLDGMSRADSARIYVLKDLANEVHGDICLFVSHAPNATLKPHVEAHISQLVDLGISVVLIINTDLAHDAITVEPNLQQRLSACLVRENLGFDFAAWAHAYTLFASRLHAHRMMLVNDSIVGPLDAAQYEAILERLRMSKADVVGLTESYKPRYHLQSFYLVFNSRALEPLRRVLAHVVNLPTKNLVIDLYETRLTQYFMNAGLHVEALFPTPVRDRQSAPNAAARWHELVIAGFPFVKGSVIDEQRGDPRIQHLVPAAFLDHRAT